MKKFSFFTSGTLVAYKFDISTSTAIRVCCSSRCPGISTVGYGDLPLWDPATKEEFEQVYFLTLLALGLVDVEASHAAEMAAMDALTK